MGRLPLYVWPPEEVQWLLYALVRDKKKDIKASIRIIAAGLAASLALVSCAKQDAMDNGSTSPAGGARTIAVSFANGSTKSTLEGLQPKFVATDVIKVSNGSATEDCTVEIDGSGNASITDVRDVNIADYTEDSAVNYPAAGTAGGWTVWTESTGLLPKDAGAAFDEAMNGFVGVGYPPAVLLGKQVVAGTNYAFLCAATRVTAEPSTALAVVIVFDPIDGSGAVIRSVAGFSIK